MKKIALLSVAALFIVAPAAFAGYGHEKNGHGSAHEMPALRLKGSGGWGMQGGYAAQWNPATVETLTGKVVSVIHLMPGKKTAHGIQIKVDTGKEKILVHLGPMWFLENQDYEVKEGDAVEVIGSRVRYNDRDALLAKSVTSGGMTLLLRDDNGVPHWAAWRKR